MKIAITGSTGLMGTALIRALQAEATPASAAESASAAGGEPAAEGHTIVRFVRGPATGPHEARWDPYGLVDTSALGGLDAVVHLAGAGIGDRRWTESYRRRIRESRVIGTRTLAEALARLDPPPRVLVSGSAIGFYGDTGDEEADETAPQGTGFLADLVRDWEAAAEPAAEAGIRVVHPRTGLVLSRDGGLLGRLLPLFRLGLGGRLGSGRQWMSWISLEDQVAALRFLLDHDIAGPVNLTAPHPVTNTEFTRLLAEALHRPARLPVPATALRVALGGFADEGPLISQRVRPARLEQAGLRFRHPDLGTALADLLGDRAVPGGAEAQESEK